MQLSLKEKLEVVSAENLYFTWKALGCPDREVTFEEAESHYLAHRFDIGVKPSHTYDIDEQLFV